MDQNSMDETTATELARERSREAARRTLMAWVRTCLTLIAFGFGFGKYHGYLRAAGLREKFDPNHSTLIFGLSFIAIAMVGLFAAVFQHYRVLRQLDGGEFVYSPDWPLEAITAAVLFLVGLFGFIELVI
jgi:putative membrane protein